ncbi:MAG: amino acid adenylation domain-containing protein [Pseudomonadota bacterium]
MSASSKQSERPLSAAQMLIWLGMQRRPSDPIYNAPYTFRFRASLNRDRFEAAVRSVVAQADALRCRFATIEGSPRCIVRPATEDFSANFAFVDFSTERDPGAARDDWIAAHSQRALDPAERVFESALLLSAADDTVWFFNQHHLVADAWSTRLIYETVAARYVATAPDTPLPSFAALLDQQAGDLEQPALVRAQQYWDEFAKRDEFAEPAFFGWPNDATSADSVRISVALGEARSARIAKAIRSPEFRSLNDDIALFQLFATVLFATLFRVTGRSSLSLGAPAANRSTARQRTTVGLLMEVLALRVVVDSDDTLITLHGKVRDASMTFLKHSLPGVSSAALARTFSVLFNFVRGAYPDFAGHSVTVVPIDTAAVEPHNVLRVQVRDYHVHGLFEIDFDFNSAAMPAALRDVFVRWYTALLDVLLDKSSRAVVAVDLVDPAGPALMLPTPSATPLALRAPDTLHHRFAAHAARTPDRVAVSDAATALTYAALNEASARLAGRLQAAGVSVGQRVAICVPAGTQFAIAVLGTLQAGAVYVPIDTQSPPARVTQLLELAAPAATLVTSNLDISVAGPILAVDEPSAESPIPQPVERHADDPAYVIFTSGSTGVPKGVVCHHRGVINLLDDLDRRNDPGDGANASLWTSVGFDVSVYELFAALAAGGTLNVVPEPVRTDVSALFSWMCEQRIESAYLPPFALAGFARHAQASPGALALKRVLVGVEPIPQRTLAALRDAVPGLCIINGYGPTETTVCATLYTLPEGESRDARTPIGVPVQNNSAYVLNPLGMPVPRGGVGELYVGGVGVACGYLNDQALTNARFVSDPVDPTSERRFYRTGDRVRCLADGNLEFVGRIDHQIKLHGHRIEPAEIQRALLALEGVSDALVLDRTVNGIRQLVAYVVSENDVVRASSEWHALLAPRLPAHMIPAAFVVLRKLPQTRAGKIDRDALPEPRWSPATRAASDDPLQRQLATIWADVLGLPAVGVDEHFLDLGGTSIQAMQIAARAAEGGLSFAAHELFDSPTVAKLAALLAGRRGAPEQADGLGSATTPSAVSQRDRARVLRKFGNSGG